MEFLRRIIQQIKTQLGALTVSQRLVIILIVVIMGGAIFWMVRYASTQDMVPLMNQTFDQKDLAKIIEQLDNWEVKYEVKGDRLMVPKNQQRTLLYKLSGKDLLSKDTVAGWNDLLQDSDIWTPESHREDKKKIILQMELARALVEGWPEIEQAKVFINEAGQRRLNNITPVASASVIIQLRKDVPSRKQLAASIADFVGAANSRMKREHVKVLINGQSVPVVAEGEEISGDYINEKVKYEELYRKKILNALPVEALVQVDVKPRITRTTRQETKIAQPDQGSLVATTEETSREETNQNREASAEPGMMANVSTTGGSGGVSQNENNEETTRKATVIPGSTQITEQIGIGGIEDLTATVSVPREYFEALAKREGSSDKPDENLVKMVVERELPGLKQTVMRAIGLVGPESEQRVVVDTYWAGGVMPIPQGLPSDTEKVGASGSGIAGIASRYGEHIAISALAIVSLFMVLMMVKKASTPLHMDEEEIMAVSGKKPMNALSVEESNISDGAEAAGLLTGMELEEEDVQAQQVLEQIKNMVKESPEIAASLVNNWIRQND